MDGKNAFLTNKELIDLGLHSSANEIETKINSLNSQQIFHLITSFNETQQIEWASKLRASIAGISDKKKLEIVGKSLSLPQFLNILDFINSDDNSHKWKLSSLIVGVNQQVFSQILNAASKDQMELLKQESVLEPIQHHLTLLNHELESRLFDLEHELQTFEQDIELFDLSDVTGNEVLKIKETLLHFAEKYVAILDIVKKALALAWNTNRLDIIEGLNYVKENCHRILTYRIGSQDTSSVAIGLQARFEEHLNNVYGNMKDPHNFDALREDEPTIEAIAKFSIWYLQDYWEIGLLPQIKNSKDLISIERSKEEISITKERENIIKIVQKNLDKLGLKTVRDLKKAHIYSRAGLKEYILANHRLLEP